MQPDSAAFIWDALQAATSITSFLDGSSLAAYEQDVMRRRAVEREFEIIGEALTKLRRVDIKTATRIPGLKNAIGLRNLLIHGYAEIVDARIYDTAIEDVPALIEVLRTLLAEADQL